MASTYYQNTLKGKYQVTMDLPETLKELRWRLGYFRRNHASWSLLNDSFKPSSTDETLDASIKANTTKVIRELKAFYESASTLDPLLYNKAKGNILFGVKRPGFWPSVNVTLPSDVNKGANLQAKHPVYDASKMISSGLPTAIDGSAISSSVSDLKKNALRVQAANPFANPAAENNVQDIEKCIEAVKMVFNSYGSPYTTTKGEDCYRWLFNSRNTAMKAIALAIQESPWIIQIINNFAFFTQNVIDAIASLKPGAGAYAQLYGHIETQDDSQADSPRNHFTPLWSTDANIVAKPLNQLSSRGTFDIRYINTSGTAGTPQNLLTIYSNDTYETNNFATNYAFNA